MNETIMPGSTIGIIGGGQLGRMLALSAKSMGYRVAVLDPVQDGPCAQVADFEINAPYDDFIALKRLLELSDVVTYEFENIPAFVIRDISDFGYIPQGFRVLSVAQNRIVEKTVLNENGFSTAPFEVVDNPFKLERAIDVIGYPCILKTATGGYDGKGQLTLSGEADKPQTKSLLNTPCVLEKYIPFKKEISCIAVRSTLGEVAVFPVPENIHRDHILFESIAPARVSEAVILKAQALAKELMLKLDFYGTVAIEMFVLENDDILVNEIAPRVHNSGHFTIEACETSQFEEHIRAICGLKLGKTDLKQPAVMVNILGKDLDLAYRLLEQGEGHVHLYGKATAEPKRKMGHVTFLGDNRESLVTKVSGLIGEGE